MNKKKLIEVVSERIESMKEDLEGLLEILIFLNHVEVSGGAVDEGKERVIKYSLFLVKLMKTMSLEVEALIVHMNNLKDNKNNSADGLMEVIKKVEGNVEGNVKCGCDSVKGNNMEDTCSSCNGSDCNIKIDNKLN